MTKLIFFTRVNDKIDDLNDEIDGMSCFLCRANALSCKIQVIQPKEITEISSEIG